MASIDVTVQADKDWFGQTYILHAHLGQFAQDKAGLDARVTAATTKRDAAGVDCRALIAAQNAALVATMEDPIWDLALENSTGGIYQPGDTLAKIHTNGAAQTFRDSAS